MSSEQPRRGREGGSGTSPIGSTAAIIIAVVAVVGGFLILNQIRDDDDGAGTTIVQPDGTSSITTIAGGTVDPSQTTLVTPGETTVPQTTAAATPTTAAAVTTGATVVVANASSVDGAAGRFTTALQGAGFTTGTATNGSVDSPVSVVYYVESDAAAKPVADYLASLLGGISVEPMPDPPPVEGGALEGGASVLLMLGSDKAGKTLEEAGAPATTVPGGTATTSPASAATSAP